MPITSLHPDYKSWHPDWTLCNDFTDGQRSVKNKKHVYLPVPSGMDALDYKAYLERASFLNAMGRTVAGLSGAMTRVPAGESLSTAMSYLKEDCTGAGHTLQEFVRQSLKGVLTTARRGVFIDPDNGFPSLPRLITYSEENITNWTLVNGNLTRVVLKSIEVMEDPDDTYELVEVTVYQELYMREGAFHYRFWKPENIKATDPKYTPEPPKRPVDTSGNAIKFIPFVFLSTTGVDATPNKPPLLDLCYINRSHYMNSADLEHGRHMVSLPTPWISGVNPEDYKKGLKIGATKAWILSNSDAKVGMLEFTGKGLGHLAGAIEEKQQQMALMGARLLQAPRKQVESPELARMANAGDASILMGIALAVGEGINKALAIAARLRGVSGAQTISMNTDFIDIKLEPKEMEMLLLYYQSGVYSEEEFLMQLTLGERFKGNPEEAATRLARIEKERKAGAIRGESEDESSIPRSEGADGEEAAA